MNVEFKKAIRAGAIVCLVVTVCLMLFAVLDGCASSNRDKALDITCDV